MHFKTLILPAVAVLAVAACSGKDAQLTATSDAAIPATVTAAAQATDTVTAAPTSSLATPTVETAELFRLPAVAATSQSSAPAPDTVPLLTGLDEIVFATCTDSNLVTAFKFGNQDLVPLWSRPVGTGINDYSSRVAGVALAPSNQQCVDAFHDGRWTRYDRKFVFGVSQDKSGLFPGQIQVFDENGGLVKMLFHPGHIKDVLPIGAVKTSEGVRYVVVATALANVSELMAPGAPYASVALAVDIDAMRVLGYKVLSSTGDPQPVAPWVVMNPEDKNWTRIYRPGFGADPDNVTVALGRGGSFKLSEVISPEAARLADRLTRSGLIVAYNTTSAK